MHAWVDMKGWQTSVVITEVVLNGSSAQMLHSSFDDTHLFSRHIYARQTEVRDVSDVCTHTHTHRVVIGTDLWLCEHTLSNLSFSFSPTVSSPFLSFAVCVCVRDGKLIEERNIEGGVLERRREQRSYDWRTSASRTAWSKAAAAWPFGCGSSATLISIQIKVDWSVDPSLLVVQC